jgi:transposase
MGSKVHMAVDTMGNLLALTVTPADEQERSQVKALCEAVQSATGETVKLVWADQGYTGGQAKKSITRSSRRWRQPHGLCRDTRHP